MSNIEVGSLRVKSHAGVTGSGKVNTVQQLRMEGVKINMEEFENYVEMLEREETKIKLTPPEATRISKHKPQ